MKWAKGDIVFIVNIDEYYYPNKEGLDTKNKDTLMDFCYYQTSLLLYQENFIPLRIVSVDNGLYEVKSIYDKSQDTILVPEKFLGYSVGMHKMHHFIRTNKIDVGDAVILNDVPNCGFIAISGIVNTPEEQYFELCNHKKVHWSEVQYVLHHVYMDMDTILESDYEGEESYVLQ